jgi:hypothetical protein
MKPRPQISAIAERVLGCFYVCHLGMPKVPEPWRIYEKLAACGVIEAQTAWDGGIMRSLNKLDPDDLSTSAKKAQLIQIAIRCAGQPTEVNPQKLAAVFGIAEVPMKSAILELLRHNLISSPPSKEP